MRDSTTQSKIPKPTLVTRHRITTSREVGSIEKGNPLKEISNEATLQTNEETTSKNSFISKWKTVKPNIALKASQDRDYPLRKVRDRLESQEWKIEQVELTTKSHEEQQRQYQQQMDTLTKNIKNVEEQISGMESTIKNLEAELLLATSELEAVQQNKKEQEKLLDELKVEKSVVQGQIQVEEARVQSVHSRIEEQKAILNNIYEEQLSLQKQIELEKCESQDELYKVEELAAKEENLQMEIRNLKKQKEENLVLLSEQECEREKIVQEIYKLEADCRRQQKEIHEKEEEEKRIEKEVTELDLQEESYPQRKQDLEQEIEQLKRDINLIEESIHQCRAKLSQKENEYKTKEDALEELWNSSERALSSERKNLSTIQSQLEEVKERNEQMKQTIKKKYDDAEYFDSAVEEQQTLLVSLRNKLSTLELRLEDERNVHLIEQQKLYALQERMHRQQNIVDEMKEQRLRNAQIQEDLLRKVYQMRPNMQVFCKIDDSDSSEEPFNDSFQQNLVLDIQNSQVIARKVRDSEELTSSKFPFDQVFTTDISNQQIFRHCVAFVDQLWKGRNVCIFGYSTHNHQRKLFFDLNQGLSFLTILYLLENIKGSSESRHVLAIEFFRIWNDELEDILSSSCKDTNSTVQTENKQNDTNHGNFLMAIEISNATQLQDWLISRIDSQKLESESGHYVFKIFVKDKASQTSNRPYSITYVHLQTPNIFNDETLSTYETDKNFVSLLQLLTQLANREKSVVSHSFTCLLTNKIFECLETFKIRYSFSTLVRNSIVAKWFK
ncbi:kinesin-related protein [Galdieria sulphuraria]|uniref:Kinesin-related protein n=1 Tax=Galdieria sulphuraria TaxID=130081 RepID=M2X4K1_GALSU|nr:kinesin-related protein [Galdieria sulphuraria]EME31345.1 kinesin-related protein [Galdieria sulphuraria]|eukprot:XP_005707865.1 kinesin-related protein [Galdieria sulphuraria]